MAALSTLSRTLNSVDELQKQADLLHVEAVLVSEGINDNDDAFTRDELKLALSSPLLKPMNWQHKDDNILGAMYAVEARDLEGNTLEIDDIKDQPIELIVQGVVWHQLPHIKNIASEIVQRIQEDNLFVSMECWFDNYDYGLYTKAGELYDHIVRDSSTVFLDGYLRSNGGTGFYNGMRIGRALSGIAFGGIAFVDRPANKRSFILNHFVFDPNELLQEIEASDGLNQDQDVTKTTLFSNDEPMEVNMNDLNRAAASADEIKQGVELALDARERAEAAKRTENDLVTANAQKADLEKKLDQAKSALERLQAAIENAYAGATSDTPEEIAKIDRALDVKEGAGDAVWAAKISWLADSRKAHANAHANNEDVEADTKLIEENAMLKAKLDAINTDIRTREITWLFAEIMEMNEEEVAKFVKSGLAQDSDEKYAEWLEEKKVFAKKMIETKKKGPGYKAEDNADKAKSQQELDAEAGLLAPSQRETSVDDLGAVLRGRNGSAPSDLSRTPRSKLTAGIEDLEIMFEEVDGPNLAGANANEGNVASPMGQLVTGLLDTKKDKEV